MPANVQPIYSLTPHIDSAAAHNSGTVVGPTANTAQDGSGSNIYLCFLAGANGSYLQKIVFRSVLSPAATNARIFWCSDSSGSFTGGTTNTTTNTTLINEISLPVTTVSQTVQAPSLELVLGFAIPAGTKILVTFGTSTGAAGTGYAVTVFGGDY